MISSIDRICSVEKESNGKLLVKWSSTDGQKAEESEEFDTVLWAIVCSKTGFIPVDAEEKSSVPNVFALGDVQLDRPELTPVAIKAGKLLARRLFGGSSALMNYENIATTVFTPLEYGCVGLSEADANEKFGSDNIDIYHAFYRPLEFELPHRDPEQCYIKAVVKIAEPQTVLGLHFLGPHAGEVIQGFSAAMKCGMSLWDLQSTVGIHPTSAEEIVKLKYTKRSGKDPKVSGC